MATFTYHTYLIALLFKMKPTRLFTIEICGKTKEIHISDFIPQLKHF